MSATPQSVEEAAASLQKILNHPRSLTAMRQATRVKAYFQSGEVDLPITAKLAPDMRHSLLLRRVHGYYIHVFYVAPVRNKEYSLIVFAESEIEGTKPRFGLWNPRTITLLPIAPNEISGDLETMRYVLEVLVQKAVGNYRIPDFYHYI